VAIAFFFFFVCTCCVFGRSFAWPGFTLSHGVFRNFLPWHFFSSDCWNVFCMERQALGGGDFFAARWIGLGALGIFVASRPLASEPFEAIARGRLN